MEGIRRYGHLKLSKPLRRFSIATIARWRWWRPAACGIIYNYLVLTTLVRTLLLDKFPKVCCAKVVPLMNNATLSPNLTNRSCNPPMFTSNMSTLRNCFERVAFIAAADRLSSSPMLHEAAFASTCNGNALKWAMIYMKA